MPHLELNNELWHRLLGLTSGIDEAAEYLGMPVDVAELILTGKEYPTAEFVAAALTSLAYKFGDLFVVCAPEVQSVNYGSFSVC